MHTTTIGKCPSCGCDILITDTMLSANEDFAASNYTIRIDTVIKHTAPFVEEGCVEFFTLLGKEQAQLTQRVLDRQMEMMEDLAKKTPPVMRRDSERNAETRMRG
jgi:hypothetical protein